jgi:protein associated with RNAse G/E
VHLPQAVSLPRIVELKRTLAGRRKEFECAVLHQADDHIVVLFVAPEAMHVHGVDLPAGTVTLGHFWTERPYNVYHWLDQATGATIGHYINLSAETRLSGGVLEWLDLIVDILVLPHAAIAVLDEDEIPATADSTLRQRIADAKEIVVRALPVLIPELERYRINLWPLARGAFASASAALR